MPATTEHPHVNAPLRFRYRDSATPTPLGLDMGNRFRRSTNLPCCQLPHKLPEVFSAIEAAIVGASALLQRVVENENMLFGAEGTNRGMQTAIDAMCCCFQWDAIIAGGVTPNHVRSFGTLAKLLEPYMRETRWPDPLWFPRVEHVWPSVVALQAQYVLLCRRIRDAARKRRNLTKNWWVCKQYLVAPVRVHPPIYNVLWLLIGQRHLRCALPSTYGENRLRRAMVARVAGTLAEFLGLVPPQSPGFLISATRVLRVGCPWTQFRVSGRVAAATHLKWKYGSAPGGVACLSLPPHVGNIVHVEQCIEKLDASAVSASIDGDPWFCYGSFSKIRNGYTHAWHVAAIHNRCRPMATGEDCCERVGSFMKDWTGKTPD